MTHVWFDLDDTLIDFRGNSRIALAQFYRIEGLERLYPDADAWIENYEYHNRGLWEQYNRGEIERDYLRVQRFLRPLVDAGMAADEALSLAAGYDRLYLDLLAAQPGTIEGARELVGYFRDRGYFVGVLSNGFTDVQSRKIETAGLMPFINKVVLSDDIGVNKPDRRLFDYAAEVSGETDPRRHVMVGDNPVTDIQGAVGAGWQAIHFDPDGRSDGLFRHRVVRVGRLDEIPPLFART